MTEFSEQMITEASELAEKAYSIPVEDMKINCIFIKAINAVKTVMFIFTSILC